jgi:hypothetical protein
LNQGTIEVTLTPTPASIPGPPPISFSVDDYIINFHSGSGTQGPIIQSYAGSAGSDNGNGTANYTLAGLVPGFYTIVAIENNPLLGGCASIPLVVEIQQIVSYPAVTATQIDANTNCSGSPGTGRIELDIDGSAPESNYSYQWFVGTSISAPPLGTTTSHIAQNLTAGSYTVQITNIVTNCSSVTVIPILDNPPIISMTDADITLTHVTMCNNLTGGAALLTNMRENGVAVGTANYTFEWYDANQNILPNAGAPNTSNAINGLAVGTYFVKAVKNAGTSGMSCASALSSFEILDQTINTINVELTDFTKPTRCLHPVNITGELVSNATGTSTTGYTYSWYVGSAATGPVVANTPAVSGISIPLGLTDVTYTIQAVNNSNQCADIKTFILPLEVIPVTITASASPLTSCITNDGVVFGTVTSGNSNSYNYNWYIGNAVKPTANFTGKQVNNLPNSDYTVVAVDQADAFCESEPVTVTVTDDKIFPIVSAMQIAPLTVCDPARPDGVASASVNGNVIDYSFAWFHGTPPAGTPVFTGSDFGNLEASTYSVIASHFISGCSDTTNVTIGRNTLPIPIPQVEILSNVTSCLADNGALAASVNGNTGDFIFHWYDTDPGTPVDTASSAFIGEIYNDLSAGRYYVSATSRITGCISGPANEQIIEDPIYPDFDFRIEPASCEQSNGFLAIYMLNDADIGSVVWNVNGNSVTGPNLDQIPAGLYSVTVTSALGCATTKDVEVKTQIRPFNGVSRNPDGKNDFFLINCIENFPSNLVKIFNRAGTLVYEAEGYDNTETFFDGKSNKGLSLMGTNVPDGTYFYIIDKRDGSKPLAGYLEVVN